MSVFISKDCIYPFIYLYKVQSVYLHTCIHSHYMRISVKVNGYTNITVIYLCADKAGALSSRIQSSKHDWNPLSTHYVSDFHQVLYYWKSDRKPPSSTLLISIWTTFGSWGLSQKSCRYCLKKVKKLIAGRRAWVPDALWKPRPARFAYKNTQNLSRDDAGNEVLAALIHFAVIVRSN